MRKALLVLALLFFSAHAHAADFTGQWTLDKAQSKDLPPFYDDVQSHTLKITQDEKQLVVGVDITSAAHEPMHSDFTYPLDGTTSKSETKVRTPNGAMSVPTTMSARRETSGGLTITVERELPARGGEPMKGVSVESWQLKNEGRTLVIDRVDQMRRGTMTSTMVFTKSSS